MRGAVFQSLRKHLSPHVVPNMATCAPRKTGGELGLNVTISGHLSPCVHKQMRIRHPGPALARQRLEGLRLSPASKTPHSTCGCSLCTQPYSYTLCGCGRPSPSHAPRL